MPYFFECRSALLETIVNECHGPKLESLPHEVFRDNMFNYLKRTKEMSVSDCWTFSVLPHSLGKAMEGPIPCNKLGDKSYWMGLLDEDHRFLRYKHSGAPWWRRRLWRSNCRCTNRLWSRLCGTILSLSPTWLLWALTRHLSNGEEHVSALIARIAFQQVPYGAVVVLSDRYDFSPQCHVLILKLCEDELVGGIARRKILGTTFIGLQQVIVQVLKQVDRGLDGGGHGQATEDCEGEISGPIEFVRHLLCGSADLVHVGRHSETHCPLNIHDAVSKIVKLLDLATIRSATCVTN